MLHFEDKQIYGKCNTCDEAAAEARILQHNIPGEKCENKFNA